MNTVEYMDIDLMQIIGEHINVYIEYILGKVGRKSNISIRLGKELRKRRSPTIKNYSTDVGCPTHFPSQHLRWIHISAMACSGKDERSAWSPPLSLTGKYAFSYTAIECVCNNDPYTCITNLVFRKASLLYLYIFE